MFLRNESKHFNSLDNIPHLENHRYSTDKPEKARMNSPSLVIKKINIHNLLVALLG